MQRVESDPKGVLLSREIEYVRTRLTHSRGVEERPAIVRALLEAIDSHARVRRLAAQLLVGEDLSTVNAQLQELWALIQEGSLGGPAAETAHSAGR
jgi:hypothetical protein